MTLKKAEFEYEEDFVLHYECIKCEHSEDWGKDEEPETCSECGSTELINDTSHEGTNCDMCEAHFDIWHDGYRYMGTNQAYIDKQESDLICEDCYEKLEA